MSVLMRAHYLLQVTLFGERGGTGHRGAHACAEGLENMLVHLLSQSAVASQYPLVSVGPHIVDYKLNVVTVAWNKVVARGGMSHGPLLCHANLMGNEIVVTHIGSTWFQMRVGTCGLHTHGAPMANMVRFGQAVSGTMQCLAQGHNACGIPRPNPPSSHT